MPTYRELLQQTKSEIDEVDAEGEAPVSGLTPPVPRALPMTRVAHAGLADSFTLLANA